MILKLRIKWKSKLNTKGILLVKEEIERQLRNENTLLPVDLDYKQVKGLSNEVMAKLNDHKPTSIGQASRISGSRLLQSLFYLFG